MSDFSKHYSFTRFPDLPAELRSLIWKFAISHARIVFIYPPDLSVTINHHPRHRRRHNAHAVHYPAVIHQPLNPVVVHQPIDAALAPLGMIPWQRISLVNKEANNMINDFKMRLEPDFNGFPEVAQQFQHSSQLVSFPKFHFDFENDVFYLGSRWRPQDVRFPVFGVGSGMKHNDKLFNQIQNIAISMRLWRSKFEKSISRPTAYANAVNMIAYQEKNLLQVESLKRIIVLYESHSSSCAFETFMKDLEGYEDFAIREKENLHPRSNYMLQKKLAEYFEQLKEKTPGWEPIVEFKRLVAPS